MVSNDNDLADYASSLRVLAWWDIDVHIGTLKKRRMTARPLKELERLLAHRLHVESWCRYDALPVNVWNFEAYNYLETAEPAFAAYAMLKQLSPLSSWFGAVAGLQQGRHCTH